jgi:hypothetical protein
MKLTNEQIIEAIKNPVVEGEKSSALVSERSHILHVTGRGFIEWWLNDQATDMESQKTLDRKKKICSPKTPRITESILKQLFKIFRAKGFVFDYKFKGEGAEKKKDLIEYLKNVSYGLSMEEFMQVVWFKAMFERFNGFIAIELKAANELQNPTQEEPYLTFYSINDIHDVLIIGKEVQYIIIKKEIIKNGQKYEGFRVIDDEKDVVYIKDGEDYKINTITQVDGSEVEDSFEMKFNKIPFIQVSSSNAMVGSYFLKNSPLSKVISNLNSYQSIADAHDISERMHGNPIFFSYPVTCVTCNGAKTVRVTVNDELTENECTNCHGTGMTSFLKTDIAQGISLPITENMEKEGFPAAAAPCGYVTIDIDTLAEQRTELAEQERFIEKGALGVEGVLSRTDVKQETATRAELDLQPLIDTLSSFAGNAESVHEFCVNRIAEVRYETFERAHIHYGRKFFLRSEKEVMEDLKVSREAGANESFLRELTEELYHVRFENNPNALNRALMLLDLEPLPTKNLIEDLEFAKFQTDELTMIMKVNFNDLVERFERENGPITQYKAKSYTKAITEIQNKLKEYAKEIEPVSPPETGSAGGSGKGNQKVGAAGKANMQK